MPSAEVETKASEGRGKLINLWAPFQTLHLAQGSTFCVDRLEQKEGRMENMLCPRNSLPRATDGGGVDSESRGVDELWEGGRGQHREAARSWARADGQGCGLRLSEPPSEERRPVRVPTAGGR